MAVRIAVTLLAAFVTAGAAAPSPAPSPGITASAHRTIDTRSPAAQAAFDRGLLMLYAFNVGEAREQFRAAEAADPRAVAAYVGEATAETIDFNASPDDAGEQRGADAARRGRKALGPQTPPDERMLLDAIAQRYDLHLTQSQRFARYADAMTAYTKAFPSDDAGLTLAGYARWRATGRLTQGADDNVPTADALQIASDLDAALRIAPGNTGAHHLRIHLWEELHDPERAHGDADFFAALQFPPGTSHLEHMAGHIYDRLGEYAPMVAVNEGACANDERYFAQGDGPGQAYMRGYHDHDVEFVLYGLTTLGRDADARAFAAHESLEMQERVALRTHDDRRVLALLGPSVTAMRVIAEARLGEPAAARHDSASLGAAGASDVGRLVAQAQVALAEHDPAAAIAAYQKARAALGDDLGDPKYRWWMPVGEGLGAALLAAGNASDAERVFRTELTRFPGDPRLEFGLAQALVAQRKDDRNAREAYRAAWQGERPLTLADLG